MKLAMDISITSVEHVAVPEPPSFGTQEKLASFLIPEFGQCEAKTRKNQLCPNRCALSSSFCSRHRYLEATCSKTQCKARTRQRTRCLAQCKPGMSFCLDHQFKSTQTAANDVLEAPPAPGHATRRQKKRLQWIKTEQPWRKGSKSKKTRSHQISTQGASL